MHHDRHRCASFVILLLPLLTIAASGAPPRPAPTSTPPPATPATRPATTRPRPAISGERPILLYVAEYVDRTSLFVVKVDPVTGRFLDMKQAFAGHDPLQRWRRSFALHPEKPVLYAVTGVAPRRRDMRAQDPARSDEALSAASAFRIDLQTGQLKLLNSQVHKGTSASFISIDEGGAEVYVGNRLTHPAADFNGRANSVNVFPVDGESGALKPASDHLLLYDFVSYALPGQRIRREQVVPEWQGTAGWRFMVFAGPGGPFRIQEGGADALFEGLGGGGDEYLRRYEQDRERRRAEERDGERDRDREEALDTQAMKQATAVQRITLPRDTGASWVAFHPGGKFFYVRAAYQPVLRVYEIDHDEDRDNRVSAAAQRGKEIEKARLIEQHLIERPERNLPKYGVRREMNGGSWSAVLGEVQVHPSGKFLYVSSRDQGLTVFAIDEETGKLTLIGRGPKELKWCRSLSIEPSGKILVATSMMSDDGDPKDPWDDRMIGAFSSFAIDEQTGQIALADQSPSDFRTAFFAVYAGLFKARRCATEERYAAAVAPASTAAARWSPGPTLVRKGASGPWLVTRLEVGQLAPV